MNMMMVVIAELKFVKFEENEIELKKKLDSIVELRSDINKYGFTDDTISRAYRNIKGNDQAIKYIGVILADAINEKRIDLELQLRELGVEPNL